VGRIHLLPRAIKLIAAVLLPGLATWIGLLPPFTATANAAMLYLLAVVVAALVGGLPGGLLASVISFVGLNFFFTSPVRTLAVQKSEDFLALFVFLVVSALVAVLLAQFLNQKETAAQREREATLLYEMSWRLLGGTPLPQIFLQFAREMTELFGLATCHVYTQKPGGSLAMVASFPADVKEPDAGRVDIPLTTSRGEFGLVRITPRAGTSLGLAEVRLAEGFASQVALAVESAQLAEQTRHSQAEAETSRVRAALFSSVTHDLRTPLASIKASASSLLEEGVAFDAAQRAELLSTIVEESDRLNRLIANLLDLSKLRAGVLVPEKKPVPIEDVIESVVGRLRKSIKGPSMHIEVAEPIPSVPMDIMQIDQMISNLLENAARHAPTQSKIIVKATRNDPWAEVDVIDHGPGIPVPDREKVFEEFWTRDTGAPQDGRQGAGLGLAIARAIAAAHSGSIWIEETPGGGTTIRFRLPLEQQNKRRAAV